jgi:hypothetical protein
MSDAATRSIESYLGRLRSALEALPADEAEDIVREIRSHIRESAGLEGAATPVNVSDILERLGSPTELAAKFRAHSLARAAQQSGSPWLVLRTIFRWAALSARGAAVLLVSLVGYVLAFSFLLAAVEKPFNRSRVGLWKLADADGSWSLHLGFRNPPQGTEMLGWWIIPLGLVAGAGLFWLTARFGLGRLRDLRRTLEVPGAFKEIDS